MESRKRKRRWILVIAGAITVVTIAFLDFAGEREPIYDGQPFRYWVDEYGALRHKAPSDRKRPESADAAIEEIGTNAIPFLVQWIAFEPANWRFQLGAFAERFPVWLTGGSPLRRLTVDSPQEDRAEGCGKAFELLGSLAESAIPELERIASNTNSPNSSRRALFALSCIGSAAIPAITNVITLPHNAGTVSAMICACNLGTNGTVLMPIFASWLTSTDDALAENTMNSFVVVPRDVGFDTGILVEALIKCLSDPRVSVRRSALFPLRTLGARATPALTALTNALDDPDPEVRTNAAEAIAEITRDIHKN